MKVKEVEDARLRSMAIVALLMMAAMASCFLISQTGETETDAIQVGSSGLTYTDSDGLKWNFQTMVNGAKITGVTGTVQGDLTIPGEVSDNADTEQGIQRWTVISIGPGLYQNLGGSVSKLSIPSTVKTIEDGALQSGAFSGTAFYSLAEIDFGEDSQLEKIGDYAFRNSGSDIGTNDDQATGLNVKLPAKVESIGAGAFSAAVSVDLNEGLKQIGGDSSLAGADSITIPASVVQIDPGAFKTGAKLTFSEGSSIAKQYSSEKGDFLSSDRTKLLWTISSAEEYEFQESVSYVEANAFLNNTAVKKITIPAGLSCGMFPFKDSAIDSVEFESGVTEIPDYMFAFTKLTGVEIPASIVTIGTKAFYGIPYLTKVTFQKDSHISEIKDYAFFKNDIQTIEFGSSAPGCSVSIGVGAFYYNNNLKTVTIDDKFSINTIGFGAFAKNAVKSSTVNAMNFGTNTGILIPKEVTSIGDYAFSAVSNVTGSAEQEPSKGFLRSELTPYLLKQADKKSFSISFEEDSQIVTIGKKAFNFQQVVKIDLSGCSKLVTVDDDAFFTYSQITLPSNSSIKVLCGISYHGSGTKISGDSNTFVVPASVEEMYPINNVDSLSFEQNSNLKTLASRPSATITKTATFDLSSCQQLESIFIPINGKTTLPAGVYSIDYTTPAKKSNKVGAVVNASEVVMDDTSLTITSETKTINRNLLGINNLTIDGANELFSITSGCLVMKIGNKMILEGIATKNLTEVTIGSDSVITSIADRAFYGSSIESLIIKKGVSIGSLIFDGCNTISSVSLLADPTIMDIAGDSFLIEDEKVFELKSGGTGTSNTNTEGIDLDYSAPGYKGSFNRGTDGAVTRINGLYLGGYDLTVSGSRTILDSGQTPPPVETLGPSQIAQIKIELVRGESGTVLKASVPDDFLSYDIVLEISTKKSVSFYLLPGYDIETSFDSTTYYLAYGKDGSHVFVPTTMEGQDFTVKETSSSAGSTSLELAFDAGYAMADMAFTVSAGTYKIDGSVITVESAEDSILAVAKKPRVSDDMVQVTFYTSEGNVNGSESYTVSIPRGCTVIDSDIPVATYSGHVLKSWHLKGSDSPYDFDSILNGDVFLIASWEDVGKYVITISTPAADVLYNGSAVTSIDVTDGMQSVTLSYEVRDGYEVRAWVVSDGSSSSTTSISKSSPSLTITDLNKDLTVSMEYRYVSSSAGLLPVVNRDLPSASEIRSAVEVFEFGGSVDTSGSQWIGHSSVPLIVDDYIYVRAGGAITSEPGRIYKIESDTGYIVASAESSGTRAFYHQVSYGNGVIFDYITGNAYDLDLNKIYDVDRSVGCVEYYDGWFYTSGSTLYRFPADPEQTGTVSPEKVGTFDKQIYGSYGFTSSVFIGDYIYRVYVDGVDRGIAAMSLNDGTKVSSVALTGMENLMLDDGWISEYNGTIYLTGYTTGLFGVVSTTGKDDRVGYVNVSGLEFGNPGFYQFDGNKSFAGEFIVANGFGFVKAGSLYVFDLRTSGAVPSASTLLGKVDTFPGGHGSIVLDVTDATESNGWMTYVYSIPYYTNETTMAVMEAHLEGDKFAFNLVTTTNMQKNEYNSQAVRSDYDGRIVWYNDSGHIFSYSVPSKNNYYFYISDGTTSQWYMSSGATAADALKALGSDVARLDSANALASVWGSSDADGWTLSMLKLESLGKQQYSWTSLENLYDAANDTNHYYAILNNCDVPEAGAEFTYIADNGTQTTYKFADNIGDRTVVGKTLVSGTEVSVIRFYSDGKEIEGSALIGKTGSVVNGDFPQMYRSGWSGHWEDVSGVATELPSTFPAGTTVYKFVWVQSSYEMTISCKESGSMSYFTIGTERKAGETDVAEGHILLIAGYDSGKYVNLYSAGLGFGTNGDASTRMGVSTEGLVSVHAYLINGMPLGAFESYGQCSYEVTTG